MTKSNQTSKAMAAANKRMEENKDTWKVAVDCIHCGITTIFRLKNGESLMSHFTQQSVPEEDMCPKCQKNPQM